MKGSDAWTLARTSRPLFRRRDHLWVLFVVGVMLVLGACTPDAGSAVSVAMRAPSPAVATAAVPSSTPFPSPTLTATASVSLITAAPSATPSPSATATRTATAIPTPTSVPTPTFTPSPAPSPTPSLTATLTATAPPLWAPTPTPAGNIISWNEAACCVGQAVMVCGPVAGAKYASSSKGQPTFLDLGKPYPDPERFTVVIWGDDRGNFPQPPEEFYAGKEICVTGTVELYKGAPQIVVREPAQIAVRSGTGS